MDLVRNRNVMRCVRIIFWSVAEGYVIATDLQSFIPESYLSLLTLMTGSWEQSSQISNTLYSYCYLSFSFRFVLVFSVGVFF